MIYELNSVISDISRFIELIIFFDETWKVSVIDDARWGIVHQKQLSFVLIE